MSERRQDIQFSPMESGPSGSLFASLSPKAEREAQAKAPEFFAPVQTDQHAASPVEISPAKDRAMRMPKPIGISPAREWGTLPPPMPKHLETFPTPRRTFERAMTSMRERMERGEHVPSLDLIATHESYYARDLDREEALRNMEALAEKLKTTRERHGDKRMIQELTKRIYTRLYHIEQNTMLGLFTGSERGNCQATAKAASTILEEVGLDPKTEIAHQMFSDHVRTIAKVGKRWWVLEGRARPLHDKETLGTTIVSLEDEKRGLLGLEPSSPIELGETPFHKPDGTLENRGLFAWIAAGLERMDRAMRSRVSQKTPGISRYTGNKPAGFPGTTTIMALLGTALPFSKRRLKTVASTMAALSFLYAVDRYRDPQVETMEDLAEAIHDDVDRLKDVFDAVVNEITSVKTKPPEPFEVTAIIPKPHIDELDRRMASYYGLAHYLLGGGEEKTHATGTKEGGRLDIPVHPEAKTIGRDLYRYFIRFDTTIHPDLPPEPLVVNFEGTSLKASPEERAKLEEIISSMKSGTSPLSPIPVQNSIEFQINGETIGSIGSKEEPEMKQEQETVEAWPSYQELYDYRIRQMEQALDDFIETAEHTDTITYEAQQELVRRARFLKEVILHRDKTTEPNTQTFTDLDYSVELYKELWVDFTLLSELPRGVEWTREDSYAEELRNRLEGLRTAVQRLTGLGFMTAEEHELIETSLKNREPMGAWERQMQSSNDDDLDETSRIIKETKEDLRRRFALMSRSRNLTPYDIFTFHDAIGTSLEPPARTTPSPELQEIFDDLLHPLPLPGSYPPPPPYGE